MSVDMNLLKKLRELTQVSMSICKKALEDNNNDFEKALKDVSSLAMAKVSKFAENETNESMVLAKYNLEKTAFAMLQFSCQTDFVAKNENYKKFIEICLDSYLKSNQELEQIFITFSELNIHHLPFSEALKSFSGTFGEKIVLSNKFKVNFEENQIPYLYIHNVLSANFGKIGVFMLSNVEHAFVKNCALHASWSKPLVVYEKDLKDIEFNKEEKLSKLVLELQEVDFEGKTYVIKDFLSKNGIILSHFKLFY